MRLIDADALEKAIYEWMPKDQETWMESDIPPIENLVVSIMMTIEKQPTIDPVKHGKWIDKPGPYYRMQAWCSCCGQHSGIGGIESNRHKPYCPNCGAKMDLED